MGTQFLENILENIGREHHAAELTPSTLSATLPGNVFFFVFKKMSATLHGSGDAGVAPRPPATSHPQTPRTTKREPFARRAFGKKEWRLTTVETGWIPARPLGEEGETQ